MVRHDCSLLFHFFWSWVSKCFFPRMTDWECVRFPLVANIPGEVAVNHVPNPRFWDTWVNICICGFKGPLKIKTSMSISVSQFLRILGKLFAELNGNIPLQQQAAIKRPSSLQTLLSFCSFQLYDTERESHTRCIYLILFNFLEALVFWHCYEKRFFAMCLHGNKCNEVTITSEYFTNRIQNNWLTGK